MVPVDAIPPPLNENEDDGSVWQFEQSDAMSTATYQVFGQDNDSVFFPQMPIPTMLSTGSPDTGDAASTYTLTLN